MTGMSRLQKHHSYFPILNYHHVFHRVFYIKMELDESIIMRVYENLLANAIQYVHDTITVSAYIQENYFCIIVSDDGKNIPCSMERLMLNNTCFLP